MKNFRDYLRESEEAANNPVTGDTFAVNIREECLVESVVLEHAEDGILIAADNRMLEIFESYGISLEDVCEGCGMSESECGCGHEEYTDETPVANPGEYGEEGDMAKNELHTIVRAARKLAGMLDNNDDMPEWTQKKINKAADYVDTAADYISSQKERGIMEQSEDSPVARAVLHRIMMQHPGVLATHGPEKVMSAIDDLADWVGPVDEIGSSDVSGWTRDVIRMLAELPDEPMDVGDALDESSARRLVASDDEGALSYKVYLDRDWGEYVVKFYVNGRYQPEEDYHTDDKNDAMSTAQLFLSNDRYDIDEAEYQGRDVPLGKRMRGDVKKFKVYVRDPKTGNVKKVNFGDPDMRIKKSNPGRRKSFRARHKCDTAKDRTTARYWSCRAW